jgi:hypothetical protein
MEVEQMVARLLAEIRTNREKMKTNQAEMVARMEAKTDVNLKEMKEEIRYNQAKVELMTRIEVKIEAKIKTNNEKF